MKEFEKRVVASGAGFEVLELAGSIDGGQPVMAHCFKADKASFQLELAFAPERKPVSRFVADAGAVAGLNGGFYTLDKGMPLDWMVIRGQTITSLQNNRRPCVYLREGAPVIGFPDGRPDQHADVLQAGPMLLQGGVMVDDYTDFQEKAKQFDADITANRYPRSLFGVSPAAFYFMTVDGRSPASIGLFLHECARMAQALGATDALNLDGGGSSMMVVNGRLINNPRTFVNQPEPAERPIPTALLARRRACVSP